MTRPRKSKNAISLEAEQSLIEAAQKGSRRATAMLVALNLPYIRSFARGIAKKIIHRPDISGDVEDLVSAGVVEFLQKIPKYDAKKSNGARLWYYAKLDMRRAMTRSACDGLESVRLPRDNRIHKAHADLERGMPPEELAEKHPDVPAEARAALHRTTVSLDHMTKDEEIGHAVEDDPEHLLNRVWPRMDALDREVITLLRLGVAPRDRAKRLEISYVYLKTVEDQVHSRVKHLLAKLEDEPVVVPERDGFATRVWYRLTGRERSVLSCMRLLRERPLYDRARCLCVEPARVRPLEKAVALRVRELVA